MKQQENGGAVGGSLLLSEEGTLEGRGQPVHMGRKSLKDESRC